MWCHESLNGCMIGFGNIISCRQHFNKMKGFPMGLQHQVHRISDNCFVSIKMFYLGFDVLGKISTHAFNLVQRSKRETDHVGSTGIYMQKQRSPAWRMLLLQHFFHTHCTHGIKVGTYLAQWLELMSREVPKNTTLQKAVAPSVRALVEDEMCPKATATSKNHSVFKRATFRLRIVVV